MSEPDPQKLHVPNDDSCPTDLIAELVVTDIQHPHGKIDLAYAVETVRAARDFGKPLPVGSIGLNNELKSLDVAKHGAERVLMARQVGRDDEFVVVEEHVHHEVAELGVVEEAPHQLGVDRKVDSASVVSASDFA